MKKWLIILLIIVLLVISYLSYSYILKLKEEKIILASIIVYNLNEILTPYSSTNKEITNFWQSHTITKVEFNLVTNGTISRRNCEQEFDKKSYPVEKTPKKELTTNGSIDTMVPLRSCSILSASSDQNPSINCECFYSKKIQLI